MNPRDLTDEQLTAATQAAYEDHMLQEVSGAAYITSRSANQSDSARRRYYKLLTEQDRRKKATGE